MPWDQCELTASAEADVVEVGSAEKNSAEVDSVQRLKALLAEFCLGEAKCK